MHLFTNNFVFWILKVAAIGVFMRTRAANTIALIRKITFGPEDGFHSPLSQVQFFKAKIMLSELSQPAGMVTGCGLQS